MLYWGKLSGLLFCPFVKRDQLLRNENKTIKMGMDNSEMINTYLFLCILYI